MDQHERWKQAAEAAGLSSTDEDGNRYVMLSDKQIEQLGESEQWQAEYQKQRQERTEHLSPSELAALVKRQN